MAVTETLLLTKTFPVEFGKTNGRPVGVAIRFTYNNNYYYCYRYILYFVKEDNR